MTDSTCDKLLLQTFLYRHKMVVLVLAIVLITLLIEIGILLKTKSNQGVSIWSILSHRPLFPQRLSLKQQIARDIIVTLILSAYLCCSAIPIYNDVAQNQYLMVEAEYSRTEHDAKRNLFSNGRIYIEVNGEQIRLELPANWNKQDFPEGRFQGTVYYSKESKIVLWVELDT